MTDDSVAAAHAFETHADYEQTDAGFALTTTPFDATVTIHDHPAPVTYHLTVHTPTLNAVVADEDVPALIREGWFETFERRLEDLHGVTYVDPQPPAVSLDESGETVTVTTSFQTDDPIRAVKDAKALAHYVEGTYLEGVIPGYEYREPVAGLIAKAHARSGANTDTGLPI